MLFNSLTFVVFYVVVTTLYWSLRGWELRKNLLVVASYIFYGAWNPPFAALLFTTTAMDFWLGRQISKAQHRRSRKRWLVASVCMNLSMLGFFKYGNFLLQNFQWLLARIGIIYQPPHLDILLPVGISFYTFHSLSYTLDIYRDVLKPTRSLRDFILAVSFFPQLVAGPIVRAGDFLPQLVHPPRLKTNQFLWGLALMTLGLFEKIVLADTLLSGSADRVFGYAGPLVALDSWAGVLAFAGQIFCDFAGYSLTAIGAALTLGFHLKDNFRFPYAAIGFSDFWRRWHISLSTFLRDYLYIPLGGNQVKPLWAAANLVIVMFLGGLWHGAAWTFVIFGVLHGLGLIVQHEWKHLTRKIHVFLPGWIATAIVCYFCIITLIFFRSGELWRAGPALKSMILFTGSGPQHLGAWKLLLFAALGFIHWLNYRGTFSNWWRGGSDPLFGFAYGGAVAVILVFIPSSYTPFIYFQF